MDRDDIPSVNVSYVDNALRSVLPHPESLLQFCIDATLELDGTFFLRRQIAGPPSTGEICFHKVALKRATVF